MTNNDVVMASNAADSGTVERQREAVAELLGRMAILETGVFRSVGVTGTTFDDAHRAVVDFVEFDVTPWLAAAEERLIPGAATIERARLLVEGLVGEIRMIEQAGSRISCVSTDRVRIAADVGALRVLLEVFFGKTAELLMPALAEDGSVSLTDLTANLPTTPEPKAGGCLCGEHDHDEPELDVRQIPHAIRHATVFGAFDAVAPGGSMILVAHHDPIPLLQQLTERTDGRVEVGYQQRGPEVWRLRLTRI